MNLLKILLITIFLSYQSTAYPKTNDLKDFNQKYLSNYFSALLSYDNQNNKKALKYFNSSKYLLNKHEKFLKKYVFSLIIDGQVSKAIKQIKYSKNKNNSDFFEAKILLIIDSIIKKDFKKASKLLKDNDNFYRKDTYEFIIYETLKNYNKVFLNKKIEDKLEDFDKLSLITSAFQNCYLNTNKTKSNFINLINLDDGNYSRYLFFYFGNIIENKEYESAKQISATIDELSSSLLILQAKKWIEELEFKKFNKFFSCKNEVDILGEFFFLVSNLYSSQNDYEKSNFYLNISNYLNPNFYFNMSQLSENYFNNNNFDMAKKVLENFDKKDEVYYWYKIKKISQIIGNQQNKNEALKFIESKFKNFKKPGIRMLYDRGNIFKNYQKYEESIEFYSLVLSQIDENSQAYADILYRRGGSYERIGKHEKSDADLLKSLEINPEDPYVMNYLAYSWLERNYNIEEAIQMLERAHKQEKNDPYIMDSIGWGYYLIGEYAIAEKYLKQVVQIMPDDPIVNDHYGDILWKLNRKLQAKYFWESVLNMSNAEEKMKKKILKKLLKGPDKI
tara:strand:+ start:1683 stop:3365 length:1683 start_codon:yes stop_codon:yes gene_type:complete